MKFRITLKDPDGFYNCLEAAADAQLADNTNDFAALDDEEKASIREHRKDKMQELVDKFFEYGEYCTIEFDIEQGTAKVVRVNE